MFILTQDDTRDEMRAALDNPNVAFFYGPCERTFRIPRVELGQSPLEAWQSRFDEGMHPLGWGVVFCPWTRQIMPPGVSYEWTAIVEDLFDSDYASGNKSPLDLPEEFRTEEWWQKRNIKMRPPGGLGYWPENGSSHFEDQSEDIEPDPHWIEANNYPAWEDWDPFQDAKYPGHSRWLDQPPHHCQRCEPIWFGSAIMYAYLPHVREYGIRIIDPHTPVDHQPIKIMPVNYCFQCGEKLPPSLRTEWEQRMVAEGLDPTMDLNPFSEKLPKGLSTEAWWREEQQKNPNSNFGYPPLKSV